MRRKVSLKALVRHSPGTVRPGLRVTRRTMSSTSSSRASASRACSRPPKAAGCRIRDDLQTVDRGPQGRRRPAPGTSTGLAKTSATSQPARKPARLASLTRGRYGSQVAGRILRLDQARDHPREQVGHTIESGRHDGISRMRARSRHSDTMAQLRNGQLRHRTTMLVARRLRPALDGLIVNDEPNSGESGLDCAHRSPAPGTRRGWTDRHATASPGRVTQSTLPTLPAHRHHLPTARPRSMSRPCSPVPLPRVSRPPEGISEPANRRYRSRQCPPMRTSGSTRSRRICAAGLGPGATTQQTVPVGVLHCDASRTLVNLDSSPRTGMSNLIQSSPDTHGPASVVAGNAPDTIETIFFSSKQTKYTFGRRPTSRMRRQDQFIA